MNRVYWFTGQPGSGKTTLAKKLKESLGGILIDGDTIRKILGTSQSEVTYTYQDRLDNSTFISSLVITLFKLGNTNIFVSSVSPFKHLRDYVKISIPTQEIYCFSNKKRGREHLFAKNYEKPTQEYLSMDTGSLSIDSCIKEIKNY